MLGPLILSSIKMDCQKHVIYDQVKYNHGEIRLGYHVLDIDNNHGGYVNKK